MGIRVRMDSRASNSDGRAMIGSCLGRKPRVVETMKAGRVVSSGRVSVSTSKVGRGVDREPILNFGLRDKGASFEIKSS
jgi:hypothetical protein